MLRCRNPDVRRAAEDDGFGGIVDLIIGVVLFSLAETLAAAAGRCNNLAPATSGILVLQSSHNNEAKTIRVLVGADPPWRRNKNVQMCLQE